MAIDGILHVEYLRNGVMALSQRRFSPRSVYADMDDEAMMKVPHGEALAADIGHSVVSNHVSYPSSAMFMMLPTNWS